MELVPGVFVVVSPCARLPNSLLNAQDHMSQSKEEVVLCDGLSRGGVDDGSTEVVNVNICAWGDVCNSLVAVLPW